MTDSAWLLDLLSDGHEHELSEIIRRSQDERGYGLTVHSRVAQLRPILAADGKTIVQRSERHDGRVRSYYRLVSLAVPEVTPPVAGVGAPTTTSPASGTANDDELSLFDTPAPRERFAA